MSYTPGQPPEDDDWSDILSQDADEVRYRPMPWYRRVLALPCFVVLAAVQIVRRRWAEWRGRWR